MSRQRRDVGAWAQSALGAGIGFTGALLGWWAGNKREFPWRVDRTPYRVLVSELLLKRTTSAAAARVFAGFLERYPDIIALAEASEGELRALFSRVGLQGQRAKAAKAMALYVRDKSGGEIPRDYNGLRCVPGVGDYTACAVLSFGYGVPAAVVDSNVVRVLSRCSNGRGKQLPVRAVKVLAGTLLPEDRHAEFNYALLDLGSLVCQYGRPLCGGCPVSVWCEYARG